MNKCLLVPDRALVTDKIMGSTKLYLGELLSDFRGVERHILYQHGSEELEAWKTWYSMQAAQMEKKIVSS